MALTKEITQDRIEVVGEFKHVQVRTKTAVMEDGVELRRRNTWSPELVTAQKKAALMTKYCGWY